MRFFLRMSVDMIFKTVCTQSQHQSYQLAYDLEQNLPQLAYDLKQNPPKLAYNLEQKLSQLAYDLKQIYIFAVENKQITKCSNAM